MDSMHRAYEYLRANLFELSNLYEGKYLLIRNDILLGAYDDEQAAMQAAKDLTPGSFLVDLCTSDTGYYECRLGYYRFTTGIARSVVTEARLRKEEKDSSVYMCDALWDTGATRTCISQDMVDALGLEPLRTMNMTHGGGDTTSKVYQVCLELPGGIVFPKLKVPSIPNVNIEKVVIGMDIIMLGDFAITHKGKRSVFSFRIPSQGEIIDFELK